MEQWTFERKTRQYRTLVIEAESFEEALKLAEETPLEAWELSPISEVFDGPILDEDGDPINLAEAAEVLRTESEELNLLLDVIRKESDSIAHYDINTVMDYEGTILGFDILTPSDIVIRLCPFDRMLTVDYIEHEDRNAIAEVLEYLDQVR